MKQIYNTNQDSHFFIVGGRKVLQKINNYREKSYEQKQTGKLEAKLTKTKATKNQIINQRLKTQGVQFCHTIANVKETNPFVCLLGIILKMNKTRYLH